MQPAERTAEIDPPLAADPDFVSHLSEAFEPATAGLTGGENDDRGKLVLKNLRIRAHRTGGADNNAHVVFGQAAPQAQSAELCRPGSEVDRIEVHRSSAGHDRIRPGAQLQQMVVIARTAEGR